MCTVLFVKGAKMGKYNITAREGEKRIFMPKLQGHKWDEHPHYGEHCTVVQSGAVYDVHMVVFCDGSTEWANGYELVKE